MTDPNRRDFIMYGAGTLAAIALLPELAFTQPRRDGAARNIAVIGLGRQGRAIIDELRKLDAVTVAAVCDILPARLQSGSERAPAAAAFADYHELLAKGSVEAVVVATPTHLHRDIALAALSAGKHVYCEAPLAATIEDCNAIAQAASGSPNLVFQTGIYGRANPIYQRARLLARSDSLRDMVSLYAQSHRKTTWRVPGAEALNWRLDPAVSIGLAGEEGTHQFDVAAWLRNKYPVRIAGNGAIRLHDDGRKIPDTIALQLMWDDGVAMHYQATLANSYGGTYEIVNGTNGSLRLAGTHGWMFKEADAATQGWEVYATRQQFFNEEGIVLVADATKLAAQGKLKEGLGLENPPLYYALAAFVNSFINAAPIVCSARDGARATTIGILANQAILTGRPVDVPPSS
ncbi:MAG TPA: Gfo/Idh/MocA family oxidoreductase [Longimicrobiales bacterium]